MQEKFNSRHLNATWWFSVLMTNEHNRASLVAQLVKNLPAMWETWVWSLGWENPLEMATHSSILAWRIPWTEEETGGLQSPWGHKEWNTTQQPSPAQHNKHNVDRFLSSLACSHLITQDPDLTILVPGLSIFEAEIFKCTPGIQNHCTSV